MKTSRYKIIISNLSYLSLLELLGLFFPLITYPYLIKVLGKDTYGAVVMAQSIVAYLVIMVNFGFNVSAAKDVSKKRNNHIALSHVVSSIFLLKSFIFLLVAIIYISIILFTDIVHYKFLYLFSLGLCIQEIYFPTWFFQGMERMKYITIISFMTRFLSLFLIFLIIKSDDNFIFVPLLNSLGGIFASIVSFYILIRFFSIRLSFVPFRYIKLVFCRSIPFFFSRFISVAMEKTNAVLIGTTLSYGDLAVYDLGTKIVGILRIPFNIIAQVLYPSVAYSKDISVVKTMLKVSISVSFIIIFFMFFIAPYVIDFLGSSQLDAATNLVYVLNTVLPAVGISSVLGASTLVTFGYIKEYNLSVIYSSVSYSIIIALVILLGNVSLYTMALAYILPEYIICAYRYYISKKYILK